MKRTMGFHVNGLFMLLHMESQHVMALEEALKGVLLMKVSEGQLVMELLMCTKCLITVNLLLQMCILK